MARRKTQRLAYCEYVSQDPSNSTQIQQARDMLFEAVKRVYPTLLQKLSFEVFPLYSRLAESGYQVEEMAYSRTPYALLTADYGLKEGLAKWAAEFNAESGWVLDDALRTMQAWLVTPQWRESLRWSPIPSSLSSASTGDAFRFEYQGWETQLLAWRVYSDSLRQQFENKLSEYERETRKLAEFCGLVRARQKYSPDNFEWFVLYQFAGRSSTEIARKGYGADPDSTVLKGIKAAAKLIGWDHLRKPIVQRSRKIR